MFSTADVAVDTRVVPLPNSHTILMYNAYTAAMYLIGIVHTVHRVNVCT